MGPGIYILKDGMPVATDDVLAWSLWFETADAERIVGAEQVDRDVFVSTVFLGLDQRLLGRGLPLLWETLISGGPHDGYRVRYSTRAEAEAGHLDAVEIARGDKWPDE
jgi:hypothetical protein